MTDYTPEPDEPGTLNDPRQPGVFDQPEPPRPRRKVSYGAWPKRAR